MGEVYLARECRLDRDIALKQLVGSVVNDGDSLLKVSASVNLKKVRSAQRAMPSSIQRLNTANRSSGHGPSHGMLPSFNLE
jgi:hypothetical protein